MRHRMSLKSRRELLAVTAPRYQAAGKKQKQQILDEFVAATGYHRRYAIPLLTGYPTSISRPIQGRSTAFFSTPRSCLATTRSHTNGDHKG
jgi:hypothetical protein